VESRTGNPGERCTREQFRGVEAVQLERVSLPFKRRNVPSTLLMDVLLPFRCLSASMSKLLCRESFLCSPQLRHYLSSLLPRERAE